MKFAIGGLTRFAEKPDQFKTIKYSANEKQHLLEYMQHFSPDTAGGMVDDCKKGTSTQIPNEGYTDGTYRWSKQDIYHIEHYNAAVKPDFLKHVNQLYS